MPRGDNAGRKKGGKNRSRVRNLSEAKAASLLVTGELLPMDVILDEMRYWDIEVKKLDRRIKEAMVKNKIDPDESFLMLPSDGDAGQVVARYYEARGHRLDAAELGAPYLHSRMSPIQDPATGPMDLTRLTEIELHAVLKLSEKVIGPPRSGQG